MTGVLQGDMVAEDNSVPVDLDAKLSRKATAKALRAKGFPVSEATLATYATRGGGPAYRLFGRRSLYTWRDALAWAEGRLTMPITSTSEAARVRAA